MCSCKKISCANKKCSCFKAGKKCNQSCKCSNCSNVEKPLDSQPLDTSSVVVPKVESIEPTFELPSTEASTPSVFGSSLKILSWNLCRFSSVDSNVDELKKSTESAFKHILTQEFPDILMFQEFPKISGANRLGLISSWMGDEYDVGVSEDEHIEHVFMWRKSTIRPLKPIVDQFVRPIIKDGLKRAAGTMRFLDLVSKIPLIVTSVHLKSGGGRETMDEYNLFFSQYDSNMKRRYGDKFRALDGNVCHIVGGDFNLNPHHKKVHSGWVATGSAKTKTSSGFKGYDFFLVNEAMDLHYGYDQRVLVQHHPKNSSLSIQGISDHDPIIMTMWRYRQKL